MAKYIELINGYIAEVERVTGTDNYYTKEKCPNPDILGHGDKDILIDYFLHEEVRQEWEEND